MTARGAGVLLSTPKREIPGEHHERGHEGKSPSLPRLLAGSRGTRESIKSKGEEETAMLLLIIILLLLLGTGGYYGYGRWGYGGGAGVGLGTVLLVLLIAYLLGVLPRG